MLSSVLAGSDLVTIFGKIFFCVDEVFCLAYNETIEKTRKDLFPICRETAI